MKTYKVAVIAGDGIEQLLVEKQTLTPDLGGTASTQEVGDAIVQRIKENF